MIQDKISEEFKFTEIDKTRHYFIEEIKENELIRKKNRKFIRF